MNSTMFTTHEPHFCVSPTCCISELGPCDSYLAMRSRSSVDSQKGQTGLIIRCVLICLIDLKLLNYKSGTGQLESSGAHRT